MRMLWLYSSAIAILAFTLLIPFASAFAQERPGIHMFVQPPEGCSITDPVNTEDPYSFIKAQIQALAFARDGEKANREVLTAHDGLPIEKMAQLIAGLRQERINDTCAGFVLSDYTGSKDEHTATAANYLVIAYDELSKMTDQILKLTMVTSIQKKDEGSSGAELSKLKAKRQEILEYMTDALNLSLSLLLDARLDSNGKHDHMILSAAQKDSLLNFLHSQFPSLKNELKDQAAGDFVKQAALIESFLSGPYKPADK